MECPQCRAVSNRPNQRYCGECGATLESVCADCGYANPPSGKFCGGCGVPLQRDGAVPPRTRDETGEIRPVTALFVDICGFTRVSQDLGAEETHRLLSAFFAGVDSIVERYGGTIDKHIGDCAMAIFGAPQAHANDPERAARAALDILGARDSLAREIGRAIDFHVGVAGGQVVAAMTGGANRKDYTVTGDSVNLAARLLNAAQPGEILIADSVRFALAGQAETDPPRDIVVKGFDIPVRAWRLKALRAPDFQPGRPFVGRRAELRQIVGALEECIQSGVGSAIYLRGVAGIGKTRLVDRVRREAVQRGFVVCSGLILDFGTGAGEDVIGSLVRGLIGTADGTGNAIPEAVRRLIDEGRLDPDREVFLNDLLDIPQPTHLRAVYDAMDAPTRLSGRNDTVVELVRRAAGRQPLLICIEDLHWADDRTLAYLALLTDLVREIPLVLVVSSRIEGDRLDVNWRAAAGSVSLMTIDLGALRRDEARELAGLLVGMDEALAAACIERAEGNPLFLEHLLRSAEEAASTELPASIQAVVLARADVLPLEQRRAAQAASVLGQRFSLAALRHVLASPGYDAAVLLRHHLIRREGEGYLFTHALVREGIYASLLRSRRAALHELAAQWFADRDATLRAEHLERAGHRDAARAYLDAGLAEMAAYRTDRALQLVERGLALVQDRADRFALTCLKGDLLQDAASTVAAIAAFEAAVALAADDAERCRAWTGLAAGLRLIDRHEDAMALLDCAEAAARSGDLIEPLARIRHLRGNLSFMLGDVAACRGQHEEALALARQAASTELEARALGGLADAFYAEGKLISSLDCFRRCVALAREHGHGRVEVANMSMIAITRQATGEFEGALEDALAAIASAQRVRQRRAETVARHAAHQCQLVLGALDEAWSHTSRAEALAKELGSQRFEAEALAFFAEAQMARERRGAALDLLRRSLVQCRATGMSYFGPIVLGMLAYATDDPSERDRALEEGAALLRRGSLSHNHLYFHRYAIEASLSIGAWDDADRYSNAMDAYLAEEPVPYCDYLIRRGRALARWGRGQRDAGTLDELRAVRDAALRMKLRHDLDQFEKVLSESSRG